MAHEIYRVVSFEKVTPFTLASSLRRRCLSGHRVPPSTEGKPNSPLQDPSLFDQFQIDPEVHTLVWPNDADFDPAILHNWPESSPALKALAEKWVSKNQGTTRA